MVELEPILKGITTVIPPNRCLTCSFPNYRTFLKFVGLVWEAPLLSSSNQLRTIRTSPEWSLCLLPMILFIEGSGCVSSTKGSKNSGLLHLAVAVVVRNMYSSSGVATLLDKPVKHLKQHACGKQKREIYSERLHWKEGQTT